MAGGQGWSEPPHPTPVWRAALGLGFDGPCRAVDADGQPCVLRMGHQGSHRDAGIREWLLSTTRNALIRTYQGPGASGRYVAEARLFAAFGFEVIACEDVRVVTRTGPGMLDILVLGMLAGLISSTRRSRRLTVCYHRCGTGPWDELAAVPLEDDGVPWPPEDDSPLSPVPS